jgi:1-acyl-sn-glycerol-3-phosphate acyltransferase
MGVPHISRFVLWFFRGIVRRYFRRHFSGVRLSRASNLANFSDERLIVYANHSSWWDPMVLVLMAAKLMPKRDHFAPMDAAALERYGIFKRIGVFGVEMKTARGAAQFLRTGSKIVQSGGILWVTPQGRFADSRERPLGFKPGLAALAAKMEGGCTVLPLAIEYVFWDERLPETLLHFGEPIRVDGQSVEEVQSLLEAALLKTMEALKAEAMARNPTAFSLVHDGTVGTGGFYEIGQRIFATVRRRRFQPEHTAISIPPPIQSQEERG